jgi:hypothetical protein
MSPNRSFLIISSLQHTPQQPANSQSMASMIQCAVANMESSRVNMNMAVQMMNNIVGRILMLQREMGELARAAQFGGNKIKRPSGPTNFYRLLFKQIADPGQICQKKCRYTRVRPIQHQQPQHARGTAAKGDGRTGTSCPVTDKSRR